MSYFSQRKKAILRWGYDRLWHRWPLLLYPLIRNFRKENHYFPNVLRPRTFNEKTLYRMLFDRRAFLHCLAGKLESRPFITRRLGPDAPFIPLAGVVRRPEDLASIALPARFIMKANHGSAMLYVHDRDEAPDLNHLQQLCREWITYDYGKYFREWVYNGVERCILIEPLLSDLDGSIPIDYKFFCYDGVPLFIKTDSNRFSHHTSSIFHCDWTHIPGHSETPACDVPPPPPPHLAEMLEIARKLSRGMDFIRVDLYDTSIGVRVGELTNTPAAAAYVFTPRELDYRFGKPWNLVTKGDLPDAWPTQPASH